TPWSPSDVRSARRSRNEGETAMTGVSVMVLLLLLLIGIALGAGALWVVGRLRRQRLAELESGAQATAARILEEARKEGEAIRNEAPGQARDILGQAYVEREGERRGHRRR